MRRKQILLVEPDERVIELCESQLGDEYKILVVREGLRAIEFYQQELSLAIIAGCLNDVDGLTVLELLRQRYPDLPLIFISAIATRNTIFTALRLGAVDFFEKPLRANEFIFRVKQVLARFKSAPESKTSKIELELGESENTLLNRFFQIYPIKECKRFLRNFPRKSNPDAKKNIQSVASPNPYIEIEMLGQFKVFIDGKLFEDWPGKKAKEIFAYLIIHHHHRISRDKLMEKFWPRSGQDSARNCLNVTLHHIRNVFQKNGVGNEIILYQDTCYYMNPEIELQLDMEEFIVHWRLAQGIERQEELEKAIPEYELATALYKDDFLTDFEFESWTELERDNLKEIHLVILNKLSHHYSCNGQPETSIKLCESILEIDSCREDVHRRLMKCYCRIGERNKALRQYFKCVAALKEELSVEPTRQTLELFNKIKEKF